MSSTRHASYRVDFRKASLLWGIAKDRPESVADLFSTRIRTPGGKEQVIPTHYDPKHGIRVIRYDDAWKEAQEDIARYFSPGEVFIGVKHHKPAHPTLESADKDAVKFDATHISVGVGVQYTAKDGSRRDGAVTLNNPQDYHVYDGLFCEAEYPIIFLRLRFPPQVSMRQQTEYIDNIRTWLVIANTFTVFPEGTYNGGDPLGTRSVSAIRTLGDKLLDVLVDTPWERKQAAQNWLQDDANKVYCSELAHVALNLGVHYPLNERSLGDRLAAVRGALESKAFLSDNANEYAELVDLSMAPESLVPITELIGMIPTEPTPMKPFGDGLALRPMSVTDLVQEFVQLVPREVWGEQEAAALQGVLFKQVRIGLIEQMALHELQAEDPRRQVVERLLDKIEAHVGKPAGSYREFRAGLEPLLREASKVPGVRADAGSDAFMPPHCWLLHALGRLDDEGGVMGLTVVGHGLHASILRPTAE